MNNFKVFNLIFLNCLLFHIAAGNVLAQGVTIGAQLQPHPSAGLDLSFPDKGFLMPRITTAQRNSISAPAVGLQIYNIDTECFEGYFSSGWKSIGCNCTAPPPAPSQHLGANHVCEGASMVQFSVSQSTGAQTFLWNIPSQDTLVSGQGTNSITISFAQQAGIRTISVIAQNSCGNSSSYTFQIEVNNPSAQFTFPSAVSLNNAATFAASSPAASYSWTFQNGSPPTSSAAQESVTWTSIGTYQVSLLVTDSIGCQSQLDTLVTPVACSPFTHTFTPCGATGPNGPSQAQCNATYGAGFVSLSGGIQEWVVPASGTYRIEARGAIGGRAASYNHFGRGATMRGDFTLTAGQTLRILVGQSGANNTASGGGAGGGGTYVVLNNTPLIVAGGGSGGGNYDTPNFSFMDGRTTNYGPNYQSTGRSTAGGGGGSFSVSGLDANGGRSFTAGGTGGGGTFAGGFGGGGGHGNGSNNYTAGGGGYSGGDEIHGTNLYLANEGGGGSFNSGTNQLGSSGTNNGTGSVTITRICQ
jgi:hypothetical protein